VRRLEATRLLLKHAGDAACIASLGNPAYDLALAGDRPEHFYTWGSMGLASSVGLGLAIARPDRRVIVLDGDGSLLMNLGSLATIATVAPPNLLVIVWDNGSYALTGGQATPTAARTDLAAVAAGAGIAAVTTAEDLPAFEEALTRLLHRSGPGLLVARVEPGNSEGRPPADCVFIKTRFMEALGSA
jgi:thiamine pyrophosphate-dependent acetolactate synthase large subunit-like protein